MRLPTPPDPSVRRYLPVILVVMTAALWFLVRHQLSHMDAIFFQPSVPGVKGLALYLAGDYAGAAQAYRAHFREFVEGGETTGDPLEDMLLRGDLTAAKAMMREALEDAPSNLKTLVHAAAVALEEHEPEEAREALGRVLQADPDHADALVLLSLAFARSGASGDAVDALNRTLRNNRIASSLLPWLMLLETTGHLTRRSKSEQPLCLLATYHRYLRIFDPSNGYTAIRYAEQAIAAGDRPADAYLTIGIVYQMRGKHDKALDAFLNALHLDPRHAHAALWAGVIYGQRGDLINESRMYRLAVETAPDDHVYTTALIHVLMDKLGDYEQAKTVLQKAVERDSRYVEALVWLGHADHFLGDDEQAVEDYRRALTIKPDNVELLTALVGALIGLDRDEEGVAVMQRAIALEPDNPQLKNLLGELYMDTQQYREAAEVFEATAERGSLHPALCNVYTWYLAEYAKAQACYKRLQAENPKGLSLNAGLDRLSRAMNAVKQERAAP